MSQSNVEGSAFVLGKNIDTDQIIPAEHLVYSLTDPEERKFYGRYALSGVPDEESGLPQGGIPLVQEDAFVSDFNVVIGSTNFGCGSSREHAPAAMQIAGIKAVIAPTYARIFYRNAVDGGFLIPYESEEDLSQKVHTGDKLAIEAEEHRVHNVTQDEYYAIRPLGSVAEIVKAGGIFDYARNENMIPQV